MHSKILSRSIVPAFLINVSYLSYSLCDNRKNNLKVKPCIAATWMFGEIAVKESLIFIKNGKSAIDAVEAGIRSVELDNQDQYWVGVGGFPNSDGKMELDAAIMDSECNYGAVLAIQDIKNPISVARSVKEKCIHNVLVGDGALKWALHNGFERDPSVLTKEMKEAWLKRQEAIVSSDNTPKPIDGHDTIGLICLDANGHLSCGTSTSGYAYKHPGRVGDAPLVGSGLYCSQHAAAVATGDGEEIMRVLIILSHPIYLYHQHYYYYYYYY